MELTRFDDYYQGRPPFDTVTVRFRLEPNTQVANILSGNVDNGCLPGDQVTLMSKAFSHKHQFAGVPAVFARVRSNGNYGKRTRIPKSRTPKKYAITARCGGGNFCVTRKLKVLPP